ncbi:MAG TPA: hypothetical protein VM430_18705, partial [Microbacterium sp.]|nr:hypothetical protein [Microbacterium sp.]
MARKKHDDEDARGPRDDQDDGTDWLLAQLVTGRTPESAQPPASAEAPAAPVESDPEAVAPAPTAPD